ncbi:MAG: hypothetical protein NVSMB2_07440 [Chloroflexota bacterium]
MHGLSPRLFPTLCVGSVLVLLLLACQTAAAHASDEYALLRWERIAHIGDGPVAWLAVSPDAPSTGLMFARVADPTTRFTLGTDVAGGATRRSRDGGRTWDSVPDPPGRIVVPPGGVGLFSLAADHVYRSTDLGLTWTSVANVATNRLVFSPAFATDGMVFLGSDDQLWRSTDRGQTWMVLDPADGQVITSVHLSPAFGRDRTLFTTAVSSRTRIFPATPRPTDNLDSAGALVSHDAGDTWTSLSDGLDVDGVPYRQAYDIAVSPQFADDQTLYVLAVGPWPSEEASSRVCPRCPSPPVAVFRSTDGGQLWTVVHQQGYGSVPVSAQLMISPQFHIDGTLLYSVSLSGAAPSQFGCSFGMSIDAGTTWRGPRAPDPGGGVCGVGLMRASGSTVLLGYLVPYYLSSTPNQNILRSLDGDEWAYFLPPGDGPLRGYSADLAQRYILAADRVFQATAKGDLWEYAAEPPCAIQPILGFGQVWNSRPDWREAAGCPVAQEQAVDIHLARSDAPYQGGIEFYITPAGDACVEVYRDISGAPRPRHVETNQECASLAAAGRIDGTLRGSLLRFPNGQFWLYVADAPGHGLLVTSDGKLQDMTPVDAG